MKTQQIPPQQDGRRGGHWWVVTLAAAFVSGWALTPADDADGVVAAASPLARTTKTGQRDLSERTNPSARFVGRMLEEMDAANAPDAVAAAADRAGAARAAIDAWLGNGADPQLLAEARLRFAHWLDADPKAAVVYWNGSGKGEAVDALANVARDRFLSMNPSELVDWFRHPELAEGAAKNALIVVLAKLCSEGKNVDLLGRAVAGMDSATARSFQLFVVAGWPSDHLKPLEEYLRENPDPRLVQTFVFRIEPMQLISWLRNEIATNGSFAEFVRTAAGWKVRWREPAERRSMSGWRFLRKSLQATTKRPEQSTIQRISSAGM